MISDQAQVRRIKNQPGTSCLIDIDRNRVLYVYEIPVDFCIDWSFMYVYEIPVDTKIQTMFESWRYSMNLEQPIFPRCYIC